MIHWNEKSVSILREMRAIGKSALEISGIVGRSKQSVNNKLHSLGLTKDGQRNALKDASERANDLTKRELASRQIDRLNTYSIGYVLGVLLGDGFISRQKRGGVVLGLGVRSKGFAEKFAACLVAVAPPGTYIRVFDYTYTAGASLIKTPEREVIRKEQTYTSWNVTCCSQAVASFFESMKDAFLSGADINPDMEPGVLDGLFDSEGFFVKSFGYAGLSMTNHFVVRWISRRLEKLGVDHKVYMSRLEYTSKVSVHRKDAVRKFCGLIRFSVEHREQMRLKLLED